MPEPEIEEQAERFLEFIRQSRRGKFKVYIGMSAGVGKTFRMLLEAKILLRNGVDVKIGYVETHGRKETHELLEGLPAIARKHGTAAEGSGDTILMRLRKKP